MLMVFVSKNVSGILSIKQFSKKTTENNVKVFFSNILKGFVGVLWKNEIIFIDIFKLFPSRKNNIKLDGKKFTMEFSGCKKNGKKISSWRQWKKKNGKMMKILCYLLKRWKFHFNSISKRTFSCAIVISRFKEGFHFDKRAGKET